MSAESNQPHQTAEIDDSRQVAAAARPSEYIAGWKYGTYQGLQKGDPFDHAGSEHFGSMVPGDIVWFVSVNRRRLFLVARIVVGAVVSREEARTRWKAFWDAKYHVAAVLGSAEPLRKLDITNLIPKLRFLGRSKRLPPDFRQSFRSLRRPTQDSCELLGRAWFGDAQTDGTAARSSAGADAARIRVSFDALVVGEQYDRPELAALWGYRDWHAIGRGCVTPADHRCIILFITREKQGALTQYEDHFDGDRLYIEGETNHSTDRRLVGAREGGDEIHLFYRDEHHSPFTYFGPITLVQHELRTDVPSRFMFATRRTEAMVESVIRADDRAHGVVDDAEPDAEGGRRLATHVRFERSATNRALAITMHGTVCKVCGFDFNAFYGADLARDFIQIHHTRSITELNDSAPDIAVDLVPLCSNCHSMAHRERGRIVPISDLRSRVQRANVVAGR